jgi:hypothetical protein
MLNILSRHRDPLHCAIAWVYVMLFMDIFLMGSHKNEHGQAVPGRGMPDTRPAAGEL